MDHESVLTRRLSHLQYLLVQARQPLALGPNNDPSSQIQMFSPYRLSSTHPTVGCQKGMPLAINTPQLALLRYIVRVALDSDP